MPGPLSTLKVLDFSGLLPGPFGTMLLADMGAEVLRVESPSRPDMVRMLPPMDAGVSAGMMYRYYPWTPPQILLTPIAGTMGWGMPGAVAAALRHPDRQVICMIGDGGMLMGGMELAAASERNLPITIVLANNSSYGAIRVNLDRAYPGRRTATELHNPDFVMMAKAFGCRTFSINAESEISSVLDAAFAERTLTLIDVNVIKTTSTLPVWERLVTIEKGIDAWIEELRPDAVSIERIFARSDVSTIMGTAQASGLAMVCAARRGNPVALHTPSEVKAAVSGNGRADKAQVGAMVTRILRLSEMPKPGFSFQLALAAAAWKASIVGIGKLPSWFLIRA